MLLTRSVLFQISILVVVSFVKCEEYDAEYEALNDGDSEESYTEERPSHPDYTKYFNAQASAPIAVQSADGTAESNGFVVPLDFSSFFGDTNFGFGSASNQKEVLQAANPFVEKANPSTGFVSVDDFRNGFAALASDAVGTRDYFEASKQKQQKENEQEKDTYESKPGPSYISHKTPAKYAAYTNKPLRTGYATEVHDLTEKPPKLEAKKQESEEAKDYSDPSTYDSPNYSSLYVPPQPIVIANPGKVVDYNVGKSSSTVSQSPYATSYYDKLLKPAASLALLSPYEKYSFQPASSDYVGSVLSTAAPFNPSYRHLASTAIPSFEHQASANEPKIQNNRNCKKVDKQITAKDISTGRFKRQAMNCFVCQDPKTKANYEQCSYSSEPKAAGSYYSGSAQKYSSPSDPDGYRYKRESEDDDYKNPYDYVKSQSQKYYSRPKEFDENKHYLPKDFGSEYRFSPEYFSESSTPEKSFSETKAEELVKSGENCKKVKRDEMTCVVCTSSETGGNYEQCSYTSAPEQQKYAYVREQKYDSNDPNPNQEKSSEGTNPSSASVPPQEKASEESVKQENTKRERHPYESEYGHGKDGDYFKEINSEREPKSSNKQEQEEEKSDEKDKSEEYDYHIPAHFEETTHKDTRPGGRGLDPTLYGSADSTENVEKKEKSDYPELNSYHFKYFPEFLKEESKKEETAQPDPSKKDVEEVLAEFAKKDRSQCKKAQKNGMTCYLCVDEKGLQHEECMYVSESKPKSSHVAYHQAEVNSKPDKAESKLIAAVQPQGPTLLEPVAAASEEVFSRIRYKALGPYHEKRSPKESKNKKHPKKYQNKKSKDIATAESRAEEKEESKEGGDEVLVSEEVRAKNSEEEEIDELEDRVHQRYEEVGEKERAEAEALGEAERRRLQHEKQDDEEEAAEGSKEPETPEEFKVGDKEGAFSEDVKPVFSKALGVTLPKYMLVKSESEAVFDEFVASG